MSLIKDAGDALLADSLANDSARARGEYLPKPAALELVRYALNIGALELVPEGRKLKSGRISPYFFNSGLFKTGLSMDYLANAYAVAIDAPFGAEMDVIFGPAYKGIPLAVAIAMKWQSLSGHDVEFAFNRKEEKQHGDGGLVVGASLQGKKVLIVDDVITSGESKREAVEIIRAQGGTPIGCAVAFDRQEKGFDKETQTDKDLSAVQEFEQVFGIPLVAAATLSDLMYYLYRLVDEEQLDDLGQYRAGLMFHKLKEYRAQYGAAVPDAWP